jgi:hypothetical protein
MDFRNDTSAGSKVICRTDLPSSVPWGSFPHLSEYYQECHRAPLWVPYSLTFLLMIYLLKYNIRNFCSLLMIEKIFRVVKSAKDCKSLQFDIDCVQKWCYENDMKINTLKTNIISFTCKTKSISFN